jgi:hypothetical protein
MADFSKRLADQSDTTPVDPIEINNTPDRAHDIGPLRPSHEAAFREWNDLPRLRLVRKIRSI